MTIPNIATGLTMAHVHLDLEPKSPLDVLIIPALEEFKTSKERHPNTFQVKIIYIYNIVYTLKNMLCIKCISAHISRNFSCSMSSPFFFNCRTGQLKRYLPVVKWNPFTCQTCLPRTMQARNGQPEHVIHEIFFKNLRLTWPMANRL